MTSTLLSPSFLAFTKFPDLQFLAYRNVVFNDLDPDPDEVYGVVRFTGMDIAAFSNSAASAPGGAGTVSVSEMQLYKDVTSTDHFRKHASDNNLYEVTLFCPALLDYAIGIKGSPDNNYLTFSTSHVVRQSSQGCWVSRPSQPEIEARILLKKSIRVSSCEIV